ncbi:hypothetical protein MHYP_G00153630 [Metynnis hypsauchen]
MTTPSTQRVWVFDCWVAVKSLSTPRTADRQTTRLDFSYTLIYLGNVVAELASDAQHYLHFTAVNSFKYRKTRSTPKRHLAAERRTRQRLRALGHKAAHSGQEGYSLLHGVDASVGTSDKQRLERNYILEPL